MHRVAFRMKLSTGCVDEYKKRYDDEWPELTQILKEKGVAEYSIFLSETDNNLRAVLKVNDQESLDDLPGHRVKCDNGNIWRISWRVTRIILL